MLELIAEKWPGKKIIIFGTGTLAYYLLQNWDIPNEIIYYIDNRVKAQGATFFSKPVYGVEKLAQYDNNQERIIVAADAYYTEIAHQLSMLDLVKDMDYIQVNTAYFKKSGYVEITTAIGCTVSCKFCPQDEFIKRYLERSITKEMLLSMKDFERLLHKIPSQAIISFGGAVEPFKNRNCADMICKALSRGNMVTINTTLVGMTIEDYQEIISHENIHRLMEIRLHIPDSELFTNFYISSTYIDLLKQVLENPPHTNCIKVSCHGEKEHPNISHLIVSGKTEILHDRGGCVKEKVDLSMGQEKKTPIQCSNLSMNPQNFQCGYVLPDGNVIACSMDWNLQHIIGNLFECEWNQLFSSPEYLLLMDGFVKNEVKSLCRRCCYSNEI